MSKAAGRSLELFFVNGRPDGMLTAEVFNWTGHVLMTPRTQISEALKRAETRRTGVYILVGEAEAESLAYIGEAEDVGKRLKDHVAGKDWWTSAIMISTAGDSLHKAHVKYLEARLVELAREAGRMKLENGNAPARASLSEAQTANMEAFLDTLLMILPALRLDLFVDKKRTQSVEATSGPQNAVQTFELVTRKHGIHATARLENGEFVVLKGSSARSQWVGSTESKTSYFRLHAELVASGVLQPDGDLSVFATDFAFSSTSAAGAVINGRSTRGPTAWKVLGSDQTFNEWEAELLEEVDASA